MKSLCSGWRVWSTGLTVWLLVATGVAFVAPPQQADASVPAGGLSSLAAIRGLDGSTELGGVRWLPLAAADDVGVGEEALDTVQLETLDRVKELAFQGVKRPGFDVWPGFDQVQVVGLDSWFRVDDESWADVIVEEDFANEKFTATGSPLRVEYKFADGTRSCENQGLEWSEGADVSEACFREWEHTSEVEPQQVEARLVFEFEWVLNNEELGSLASGSFVTTGNWSDERTLTVGEVGTVVSDGTSPEPVVRVRGDAMASAVGVDQTSCSWYSLSCHVAKAASSLWDLAVGAWDDLSKGALAAAKILYDVLKGCLSNLTDAVGMVKGMLENAASFYGDPAGYVKGQVDLLTTMFEAAQEDPEAFALEMGKEAIEYQLLVDKPAQWIGKYGCEIAIGILTGGSSVIAQRFGSVAKFMLKLNKFMEKLKLDKFPGSKKRDGDRRDGDREDNDDSSCVIGSASCGCKKSSFPTGTQVRTASGLTPIEKITPGTEVLAADPVSGVWSNEVVLDQWSHVDDGRLVTAVLVDGSEITATDDHLFWVAGDGAWVELEDVGPSDSLLTPDGVATVSHVVVWPIADRLVWELDTAGPDTFTVWTGTSDVLVHNEDGCLDYTPEEKALADKLGIDLNDIEIVDGVARTKIDVTNSFEGVDQLLDLLRRNGATRAEIDSGFLANEQLDRILSRKAETGRPYQGGTVVESLSPDSDYTIIYEL